MAQSVQQSIDRIVFFVHIMKTGGTTVNTGLRGKYPLKKRYPSESGDAMQRVAEKAVTRHLFELPDEQYEKLKWVSPHMPLSVALHFKQQMQREVSIILLLREGADRAASYLRNLSLRFQHQYTYRELLDTPLLRNFFLSNHQTRVLCAAQADWAGWDNAMSGLVLLQRGLEKAEPYNQFTVMGEEELTSAIASLAKIDVLGVQDEFGDWWERCRREFEWPEQRKVSHNVTPKQGEGSMPPIPEDILEELAELNALDSQLYLAAKAALGSSADV